MDFYLIHLALETARSRHKLASLLLKLSLVVIVVLTLAGSFWWTISITSSSRVQKIHGIRNLQELVLDLKDIGQLSLGFRIMFSQVRELCSMLQKILIWAYLEVSMTATVDLVSRQTCLVQWPTEKDVICHANINITAQEVLYSGSLTKSVE